VKLGPDQGRLYVPVPDGIYLSIKLHSFVQYSPRDVHRIADKLNNARYDYLSAILWTSLGL